jgi:perosamine synthetase
MIPLCAPYIRNQEWLRIKDCVDTEWVSYAGKYVEQFEQDLASFTGAQHAAVTISGTSALHLALIVAGVKQDDEVILPALSFVAPANAIRYQGAWPTFVDVTLADWQMDTTQIEDFLSNSCRRDSTGELRNKHTGRRIAAIMPVHLLGGMADVDALARIAAEYCLPLIEDAAECLGARWKDKGIGAPLENELGIQRFTCTSFNGNKIMTTGGGGALLTNCQKSADLAKHLSTTAKVNDIEFDHDQVGYNYRMSNMAAALGVGQLEQLNYFLERKKEIAERYTQAFATQAAISMTLPTSQHVTNSYWLYTILLKNDSRGLLNNLAENAIQTRPLWKALCDLPYLQQCHIHSAANSRTLTKNALSIPSSVSLSETDQEKVIQSIKNYFRG